MIKPEIFKCIFHGTLEQFLMDLYINYVDGSRLEDRLIIEDTISKILIEYNKSDCLNDRWIYPDMHPIIKLVYHAIPHNDYVDQLFKKGKTSIPESFEKRLRETGRTLSVKFFYNINKK